MENLKELTPDEYVLKVHQFARSLIYNYSGHSLRGIEDFEQAIYLCKLTIQFFEEFLKEAKTDEERSKFINDLKTELTKFIPVQH
jgi:hypothetical protein